MRTNIVIDDALMTQAMKYHPEATKRSIVEKGLRLLVQLNSQAKIRSLRGKLHWEGNLEDMRRDHGAR